MKSAVGLICAAALLAGSAAIAQSPGGGIGIQGNQPLDVTGDAFDYDGGECRATYTGNVEMIQGTARMRSPRVDTYFGRTGATATPAAGGANSRCGGDVQRIEMAGTFYYVSPEQQARSDHATYTAANDTIVLTGNVVLTQGQNVMTGARATINTRTNDARVESGPSAQSNGRVRAVIFPNGASQPGAARAPARPGR